MLHKTTSATIVHENVHVNWVHINRINTFSGAVRCVYVTIQLMNVIAIYIHRPPRESGSALRLAEVTKYLTN